MPLPRRRKAGGSPRRRKAAPRRKAAAAAPARAAAVRSPARSPRKASASPSRKPASPRKASASPSRTPASPRKASASPSRTPASPRKALASPSRKPASPRKTSASPSRGGKAASPSAAAAHMQQVFSASARASKAPTPLIASRHAKAKARGGGGGGARSPRGPRRVRAVLLVRAHMGNMKRGADEMGMSLDDERVYLDFLWRSFVGAGRGAELVDAMFSRLSPSQKAEVRASLQVDRFRTPPLSAPQTFDVALVAGTFTVAADAAAEELVLAGTTLPLDTSGANRLHVLLEKLDDPV